MTQELAKIDDFSPVNFGDHFRVTPTGLDIIGEPSFSVCQQFWASLRTLERGLQFAIGDAAKYLRRRFGERADQIISDATGWSFETLRAYEWTADSVPTEVRHMDVLTYSHHQAVAKLSPREQRQWLDKAAVGNGEKRWPVAQLKRAIKASGGDKTVTAWVLVAIFDSEAKRDAVQSELEARSIICKASERYAGDDEKGEQ
jgi:hypothetical protein